MATTLRLARSLPTWLAAAPLGLTVACSGGSGSTAPEAALTNLGLTPESVHYAPGFVIVAASEEQSELDLNGDGDREDAVLHVHELASGETRNLGLTTRRLLVAERGVAFAVHEAFQGEDLDGDGLLTSALLFVYRFDDGETQLVSRAEAGLLSFGGDLLLFDERVGTGFEAWTVGMVYDFGTRTAEPHGLLRPRIGPASEALPNDALLGTLHESVLRRDLNGDGDFQDEVAHVYVPRTRERINLGLPPHLPVDRTPIGTLEQGLVVLQVPESEHGADLNADGDRFDVLTVAYDVPSGRTYVTPIESLQHFLFELPFVYVTPGFVAIAGENRFSPRLFVLDRSTGVTVRTELDGSFEAVGHGFVALTLSEFNGDDDHNGDGDYGDRVPVLYDITTGERHNLFISATDGPFVDVDGVAYLVSEERDRVDWNADGDREDSFLRRFDLRTRDFAAPSLHLADRYLGPVGDRLHAVSVDERDVDLNGDGDRGDFVVHLYGPGRSQNLGVNVDLTLPEVVSGPRTPSSRPLPLGLRVNERGAGFQDLNGDGDAFDVVLFAVRP